MIYSLIVPTRGDQTLLRNFCSSLSEATYALETVELILVIDQGDERTAAFEFPGLNIRKVTVTPGSTMGFLNRAGYETSQGRNVILLNDDVIVRTSQWDRRVTAIIDDYPDEILLVHINDGIFGDKLCTFPILPRSFCELMHGICPPSYLRYRIDDHIHNIFDLLALLGHRRRVYLSDVLFEHLNVSTDHYQPDPEIHRLDSLTFEALLPERKRIALNAKERIEAYKSQHRRRAWSSCLETVTDSTAVRHACHAVCLPTQQRPRVTIGVVSADMRSPYARRCLELLKAHTRDFDLILLDNNGASDFNHSREMNRILDLCRTDYLVLMDDDVFVQPGWLEGLFRALQPGVGVITPIHKNTDGQLSYAGVLLEPDDSGYHAHILRSDSVPRSIQTLCSAVMLMDLRRCGHLRLNEAYSKYFLDIDYGLQVWEQGLRVVCSPWSQVTHLGGATLAQGSPASVALFEEQRKLWRRQWVHTGRLQALRRGVWSADPDLQAIQRLEERLSMSLARWHTLSKDETFFSAAAFFQDLEGYPALISYIARRAHLALNGQIPRADDPSHQPWAVLLGLCGQPVLYEGGVNGMNIVFYKDTFYAIPADEGVFDLNKFHQRQYSQCYEAATPDGLRSQLNGTPPAVASGSSISRPSLKLSTYARRLLALIPHLPALPAIARSFFDRRHYLQAYPDIAASLFPPLLHYLLIGGFEGRNPNPWFDGHFYLRSNPDVAAAGVNPLVHYVRCGAREGRRPHPRIPAAGGVSKAATASQGVSRHLRA